MFRFRMVTVKIAQSQIIVFRLRMVTVTIAQSQINMFRIRMVTVTIAQSQINMFRIRMVTCNSGHRLILQNGALAELEDIMTSSNGNIFSVNDPLWGEYTGRRWIPLTRTPVIWDAMALIMTSLLCMKWINECTSTSTTMKVIIYTCLNFSGM